MVKYSLTKIGNKNIFEEILKNVPNVRPEKCQDMYIVSKFSRG